jgi:hypothetical protein
MDWVILDLIESGFILGKVTGNQVVLDYKQGLGYIGQLGTK